MGKEGEKKSNKEGKNIEGTGETTHSSVLESKV